MTKINKKSNGFFTITNNQLIRDDRLSWKARGIFTYLWSMSDGWDFRVNEVSRHAKDGRDSLRAGLKELEEYGYLKRYYKQSNGGKLDGYEWILNDSPVAGKSAENSIESNEIPAAGKPGGRDNRQPENPPLSNNNLRSINLSSNKVKDIYTSSPAKADDHLSENFEAIWKEYPNKAGKKEAFRHYKKWRKESEEHTDEYLMKKLAAYKQDLAANQWKKPMNGSTWFNGRFDDEYMPQQQLTNPYDRYYE